MPRDIGDGYGFKRLEGVVEFQLDLAKRALRLGCDVILDFEFFHRSDRDVAQAKAAGWMRY